jgi:hypothetical protein
MKNLDWEWIKGTLALRRERRKLTALGYRRHETDWEIHRGMAARNGEVILDAIVSVDRRYVYTKIGTRDGE